MSELEMTDDDQVESDLRSHLETLDKRMDELDALITRSETGGSVVASARSLPHSEGLWPISSADQADEGQLRETISLLKATLNSTTDGILVLDNNLRVVIYNTKFVTLWDIPPSLDREDKKGWLRAFTAPLMENADTFVKRIREQLAHTDAATRDILRFTDGRIFESRSHPQQIEGEIVGRVWSFRDVTKQRQAQELVEYQATYDPLTDLPNRRLLLDRLNQMLARCRRHQRIGALLFLDLDNFKTINDTLGHPIGDALLQQVARRLTDCLRREDTAARLGGDEFVLLLAEENAVIDEFTHQVDIAANKVLAALSEPYEVQGHRLYATTSIGVSLFPQNGENADDVLMQADTAMYRAKEAGRNTVRFFLPSMRKSSEEQLQMQNDLRQALERDELKILWQPKHDFAGNTLGAEALLRWEHPTRGLIMPGEFIPVAEDIGIITSLGNQVLEVSCNLLRKIADDYSEAGPIHLSVNISPQQFQQADFAMQVAHFLKTSGANPTRLTLELTENMLVTNLEEVMAKMVDLKRLGVRFSIDDFGTGYSSMAYLKRLPLDEIKIDRSFVNDIVTDPETVSIVEAIITMASKLGLSVVAEGVENSREFDFLRKRGCHCFQGYMLCQPLDEAEFLEFILEGNISEARKNGTQSVFEGF
ncbi:putative bifunctional diguanylate cyclase/phosphodiesterase [Sedimenticola sp.]|uniref:putative bifunctional diguanylate cyclase/phosphodiesterase n=1 Tax=Sedimenticola sp. TaxID=1940285 RepID=UPI003D10F6C7